MKHFILAISVCLGFSVFPTENAFAANQDLLYTPGKSIFSSQQKKIADQVISIFENDTPEIQYNYIEYLGDGRGYTAGRGGFTSATGDMLEVVERYTEIEPNNPLAPYLPNLKALSAEESDSIEGLSGLPAAWKQSSEDKTFLQVQDDVVDDDYYLPALKLARQLGVREPLTLLNLYDAIIQHGEGDDPDGLPALIKKASNQVGGTPREGVNEHEWLGAFMAARRATLLHPDDEDTQDEWSESVGRVDALYQLYLDGNFTLTPPVHLNPWGEDFVLTGK